MSSNTFKLTTLAALIMAATGANAALYNVEIVSSADNENFGGPVEEMGTTDCFTDDCSASKPAIATRGRLGEAGQFINNEVDFQFDNRLRMVWDDLRYEYERYCDYQYKYKTCDAWADRYTWGTGGSGGANKVINAWTKSFDSDNNNTKAYINGSRAYTTGTEVTSVPDDQKFDPTVGTQEVVINAIGDTNGKIVGNISSGYEVQNGGQSGRRYKSRGFYDADGSQSNIALLKPLTAGGIVEAIGPTRAFSVFNYGTGTYVVGSAAVTVYDARSCSNSSNPEASQACQNVGFNSKATVWDMSDSTPYRVASWENISESSSRLTDNSINSSVRGSAIAKADAPKYAGLPVLVGYNARLLESRPALEATVFLPSNGFGESKIKEGNAWTPVTVSGTKLKEGSDWVYSNSVANDINENLIVIGSTKRGSFDYIRSSSDVPSQNGSRNNRLWVADASSGSPSANYLSGGIFFDGAGGEMRAINNNNLIVGKIHAEPTREVDGKMRRERGFVYPYNSSNQLIKQGWWLDDLTNGGDNSAANNQFRIVDANDINDAGIISATAMYCSGGYETTSHNSLCNGTEKKVAVKLTPISDPNKQVIQTRSYDQDPVERQGAGFGWLFIGVLALFGMRRK